MKLERISSCAAALLLCIAPAATTGHYLLTGPGDGGQLQVGRGWAVPLQTPVPSGVFPPVSGGFPAALGVPPISGITPANATTSIGHGTSGTLTIPAGILSRPAPGTPVVRPLFTTTPAFFQAATSLRVRWPAATAMLMPGGAPGPALFTVGDAAGVISYSGGVRAFGGSARFEITAGPGAAGGVIPGQPATFHVNFIGAVPSSAGQALLVARNATLLQPGASVAAPLVGTPGVLVHPAIVSGSFGPFGTVLTSVPCTTCPAFSSRLTASKGFPWTTGFVTISVPGVPPEIFFLSGSDMRVAGVGNVSLVAGGISKRTLPGLYNEATLGFLSLTLPEPDATLGAMAALAALTVCHAYVRWRRGRVRSACASEPARQ